MKTIRYYFDHKFIRTEGGGIHRCDKCDLRVYIRLSYKDDSIEECLYLKDNLMNRWDSLKLNCDEIIIKNLLE